MATYGLRGTQVTKNLANILNVYPDQIPSKINDTLQAVIVANPSENIVANVVKAVGPFDAQASQTLYTTATDGSVFYLTQVLYQIGNQNGNANTEIASITATINGVSTQLTGVSVANGSTINAAGPFTRDTVFSVPIPIDAGTNITWTDDKGGGAQGFTGVIVTLVGFTQNNVASVQQ